VRLQIKNWNDTRIRELNPTVADRLPNHDILIPVLTTAQTSVHAVMTTLSSKVASFNESVSVPFRAHAKAYHAPTSTRTED
jgi:hypothetical protein